ncbi:hypothetical protein [uncultured Clostridium sp.]|uniref:CHASE3 domain-containing protein n=1 Tax=uncultured Clostridium sp. TaxID=59620 RepID=UPI00272D4388|nr:hypothetical protein [uncultured Clostridium sp.]
MKKLSIYFIILTLILVITLNLFLFYNYSSVSSTLNNSNNIRNTITELDKFKSTITEMSDAGEAFILTGNIKYKSDYEDSLNNAHNNLNSLVDNNIISSQDKDTIVDLIKDYESINESIFNSNISYPISSDVETLVNNSSNAKLKILHSVSSLISTHWESLEESTNNISHTIGNQKTFVSWISSIFTALMAIPPFLVKKFSKNFNKITNSTNSLNASNQSDSSNKDDSSLSESVNALETFFNFKNNVDEIKEVRDQLIQNATLINFLNVVDFNNAEMSKNYTDCKNKLSLIINEFVNIEKKCSEDSSLNICDEINSIKNVLDELSLSINNLYNYNEYMINISKLLLNNNINSK